MAETTAAPIEETPPARTWFRAWLPGHKARNWHDRFGQYEAEGDDVYQGWILAFEATGTTRREATLASRLLQGQAPTRGLLPEHHLPLLRDLLAGIQGPRLLAAEAARRAAARAEADRLAAVEAEDREAWRQLPIGLAEGYRAAVRRACPGRCTRNPGFADFLGRAIWSAEEAGDVEGAEALLDSWRERATGLEHVADLPPRRRHVAADVDRPEPSEETLRAALEKRRRDLARLADWQPAPTRAVG